MREQLAGARRSEPQDPDTPGSGSERSGSQRSRSGIPTAASNDDIGGATMPSVRTRRDVLKKAGLGAVATAAGVVAMSQPAAAADGNAIVLGSAATNNTSSTATVVAGSGPIVNKNNFTFEDSAFYGSSADYPATLGAYSIDGGNALFANCEDRDDSSTKTGHAVVAYASGGARSNLLFFGGLGDPRSTTYSHRRGEVVYASNGLVLRRYWHARYIGANWRGRRPLVRCMRLRRNGCGTRVIRVGR